MPDQSGPKDGIIDQGKVKVGEKEYSAADVQNLLTSAKDATEKSQKLSKILDAAKSYDLEPDEFLEQAIGGFTVIGNLIQEGIIDNQGKVVKKDTGKPPEDDLSKLLNLDVTKSGGGDKTEEVVMRALAPIMEKFKSIETSVTGLQDISTSLIRNNYQKDIKTAFPTLDDEDISRVFGVAMKDRKKTLMEHAKDLAEGKNQRNEAVQREFAKAHGLDYDAMTKKKSENDLKGLGPQGPAAFAEGKKFSFTKKEGFVTPREATEAYFRETDST